MTRWLALFTLIALAFRTLSKRDVEKAVRDWRAVTAADSVASDCA